MRSEVFRVSTELHEQLDHLSTATRVRRSEYVREAVEGLLKKYAGTPWVTDAFDVSGHRKRPTHYQLPEALQKRFSALSKRLRITKVALLNEAIADLLVRYGFRRSSAQ